MVVFTFTFTSRYDIQNIDIHLCTVKVVVPGTKGLLAIAIFWILECYI
jgi:hypothetical protein